MQRDAMELTVTAVNQALPVMLGRVIVIRMKIVGKVWPVEITTVLGVLGVTGMTAAMKKVHTLLAGNQLYEL